MTIRISDVYRASLPEESGNEGYIGVAPDGSAYHVVVPVDRLIARGLRFWERPRDGTPFGGYRNWMYFPCLTYRAEADHSEREGARLKAALLSASLLRSTLAAMGIEISILEDMAD